MKKNLAVLTVLCLVLSIVSIVSAADTFKVTYHENDCLASVPTDESQYAPGTTVTLKFDPVTYTDYNIFYGWSESAEGPAQYGYAYNTLSMPENDVDLYAICISANTQYAPTRPERHHHHPRRGEPWSPRPLRPVPPNPYCWGPNCPPLYPTQP